MNLPVIATVTTTPNPSHSPSTAIPTLPYDIITLIIDQLRHDVPTLRACTLTARSWTHRARLHLHRTFTLPVSVFALPSLSAGFEFGFASEEDEEKCRVVGREAPAVLRYADELELKCVNSSRSTPRGCSGTPLSTVLPLFKHIRVLRIIDADLSNVSFSPSSSSSSWLTQNSNPSWTTAFPNLENLTLLKTTFRSAHDVLRLASQFKQLRTLRVEDITISGVSSSNDALAECSPSEAPPPPIRNLHILNTTKTPNLPSSLGSHLPHSYYDTLRRLHVDTTSNLEIFTKTIGDSLPELHLSLQEEFYPLWHVHPEGKVSNMTAAEIRAAIQPVLNYKNLRVLRLSVQRSPIVRMVQTMEGMGCDSRILCSPWQVYREAFVGLGLASASEEEDREGEEKFQCRELHLSFDARDIQGPKAHIEQFETTLLSCSPSSSSPSPSDAHPNPTSVKTIKFLIKEFIDPVLPDEPARLRRLWGAFVERLRVWGDGRANGEVEVEVGVEFFDRRDFE